MASRSIWPLARSIGCVYPISDFQIISPGIKVPFLCVGTVRVSVSVCVCFCLCVCVCVVLAVGIVVHLLCPLPPPIVCLFVRPAACLFWPSWVHFTNPFSECHLCWAIWHGATLHATARGKEHPKRFATTSTATTATTTAIHMIHLTRSQCRPSRSCSQKLAMQQTCAFSSYLCPSLSLSLSLTPSVSLAMPLSPSHSCWHFAIRLNIIFMIYAHGWAFI